MANPEHLEILKQGVEVWNRWREENPALKPELSRMEMHKAFLVGFHLEDADLYAANLVEANLSRAILTGANLRRAHLTKAVLHKTDLRRVDLNKATLILADLQRADLSGAKLGGTYLLATDLTEANLTKAYFNGADLSRANFSNTSLNGADFDNTILSEVDFSNAILSEVDFTRAMIQGTKFLRVDLSGVKGLETIRHRGPSSIDLDTLERSKGNLPRVFLQGIGASDTFISYYTSLTGHPIHYYSCFISYSSQDEGFAQRLHADLQQKGVRCWFAPEDMKIGDKIRPAIDQSIRIHDKLLLILSENSLNSFWVESEVEKAFEEERRRGQTVLFPVRLDEAVMETDKAWAAEIRRTRHIGDFSRWKDHDAYRVAFEHLLRDLKAEG